MKPCDKCNHHFCRDDEIRCEGFCGKIFHLQCSGANQYDVMRCAGSKNLIWVCDQCLLLLQNQQRPTAIVSGNPNNNKTSEDIMQSTVLNLEQQIDEINQQLANLQTHVHQYVSLSPPSTSTPERTDHRFNECNSDVRSLNGSRRLLNGSKVVNRHSSSEDNTNFWIYLTGIANHVCQDDIGKMVMECLKLNKRPIVEKLVPCWRNAKDLRYISFKVGVNKKFKNEALLETTWPVGVRFREFIQYNTPFWHP